MKSGVTTCPPERQPGLLLPVPSAVVFQGSDTRIQMLDLLLDRSDLPDERSGMVRGGSLVELRTSALEAFSGTEMDRYFVPQFCDRILEAVSTIHYLSG